MSHALRLRELVKEWETTQAAKEYDEIFSHCYKLAGEQGLTDYLHNFKYDQTCKQVVALLKKNGFKIRGRVWDIHDNKCLVCW